MALDKEYLKKMFPNLYKEMEKGDAKIGIDALRKDPQEAEAEAEVEAEECTEEEFKAKPAQAEPDKLRHFNPSCEDFIRRCDTDAQAEEIISYMQKKGEITAKCARELRGKLKREGVRGFGAKKEENHYFREGGLL